MRTLRLPISCGFAIAFGLALGAPFLRAGTDLGAQVAVPAHEEPRHHLVLDRPDLRVLDVQIPPGDTTLFHTHDAPIHYVLINASRTTSQALGAEWSDRSGGAVQLAPVGTAFWNLDYAARPLTHRVANIGVGLFRLLAVVNRSAGTDAGMVTPAGEVEAESRWFRRRRVDVEAGASIEVPALPSPTLFIQVSDGQLYVTAGAEGALSEPGAWRLFDGAQAVELSNPGSDRVTVVLVEVR